MTALPEPSGFRTLTLPRSAPAELFAARLVYERIDFNYSEFDGEHKFVYPVCHYRRITELSWEMFDARQKRQTPDQTADAKAKMARTIQEAYRDSWV